MKKLRINHLYCIAILLTALITSCKKGEIPSKPAPSAFTVQVENGMTVYPAAGANVNLTINAGSNGWWIVVPEEGKQWLVPAKVYGSANQTIVVKISRNTTGASRKVEMTVNPTFNLEPVKVIFEQSDK